MMTFAPLTRKFAGLSSLSVLLLTVTASIAQAQSSPIPSGQPVATPQVQSLPTLPAPSPQGEPSPPVQAAPSTLRKTQPSPTPQSGGSLYDRAQQELPGDMYVLYRVVERLARANELDTSSWRIQITPTYDSYAFAAQPNLVAVHRGLLDQLAGDSSAIACIVGQEMGHSMKRHIALGEEQRAEQQARLAEQLSQQAAAVSEEMANRARSSAATSSVLGTVGGLLGILGPIGAIGGSVLGGVAGAVIGNPGDSAEEIMEDYEAQMAQLNEQLAATARQQELEADEAGYLYATQAGFEPEGCLRAMAVLERIPGAEPNPDQPTMPDRIAAMQKLISEQPATDRAARGNARLTLTQPLPYDDLARDGSSLRVNSRANGASDLDRVLGQ